MKKIMYMCKPLHYDVDYEINSWMHTDKSIDRALALVQWDKLYAIITQHADVALIDQIQGLPDMVFTANAALMEDNKAIISRFRHPERQGEEKHFARWFRDHHYDVILLPDTHLFEGAGDALYDEALPVLWGGYGFRSNLETYSLLQQHITKDIITLKLESEWFYHLDTCFCPLKEGMLMYYPKAFDKKSNETIESHVAKSLRIPVSDEDARNFACNAVNIGDMIIMNAASSSLQAALQDKGFTVIQTSMSEFMKAGGAVKCLTLVINTIKDFLCNT